MSRIYSDVTAVPRAAFKEYSPDALADIMTFHEYMIRAAEHYHWARYPQAVLDEREATIRAHKKVVDACYTGIREVHHLDVRMSPDMDVFNEFVIDTKGDER